MCFNQLTNIDISANSALKELNCTGNQLANLDVSENTALSKLYCGHNLLTSLDVSANTALEDLYCYNNRITNLNANTFLKYLQCTNNQLTSLDLSANHALEVLNCNDNLLTSLDLPVNSALRVLFCQRNQLTRLDVSGNVALTIFECSYNQLTSLDISTNPALVDFICSENLLTRLNAKNGNPTHFGLFMANYNPNLTCIQVDDVAYSTRNWHVNYWTSFSEICTVGIDNVSNSELHIFPNPSNGNFTIEGLPFEGVSITIYNLLGEKIYSRNNKQTVCNIDISNFPKGMYFVKVSDGKKIHINKIEIR